MRKLSELSIEFQQQARAAASADITALLTERNKLMQEPVPSIYDIDAWRQWVNRALSDGVRLDNTIVDWLVANVPHDLLAEASMITAETIDYQPEA